MNNKELVKYHNDLNSLSMRSWTAEEMDLFFTVIAKIRDVGTTLVHLDADELKVLTGTETRNSYWFNMLDHFSEKAIQLRYREVTKYSKAIYNLFGSFKFNAEDRLLRVSVTNDFEYIVNKLTANFTVYELAEFTSLRSTYSKTMYRVLKQWRTLGEKEFSVEQFRTLLEIPNSYDVGKINSRIIKQIQKELPQYFDGLKVKAIKRNTQGTPVIGYKFTWTPETTGTWNPHKYEKTAKSKQKKSQGKFVESDTRLTPEERKEWVDKKLKVSRKASLKGKSAHEEAIDPVPGQQVLTEKGIDEVK